MKPRLALLLSALLPLVAQAQVGAPDPTATRGGTRVAPTTTPAPPPARSQPQPQAVPSVQPVQPAQPIRSTGPAQITPTPAATLPDKVYDRNGRIVPGVKPVGPNRVFDSRTGRYHDSVPTGNGQQIR
ncbi:classical arabinogalactan protein 4 [Stenotrophomonas tuberculopleuritidis]|uniref:classical arabinogalactan protein 4 n=1 Tax=Stenotrophomonas tuberculopleuritidis TaxID=3055079 RepID=UPI0026E57D11|nr:classical arabinogalactan protein 4 [Stenotrophomonas sp. 704A1]